MFDVLDTHDSALIPRRIGLQRMGRTLLRLQHARQLLARTDNSVIAIAFEAGFEDLSNFNRAFKQAYGSSPKAYRDTVRVPAPDSRA